MDVHQTRAWHQCWAWQGFLEQFKTDVVIQNLNVSCKFTNNFSALNLCHSSHSDASVVQLPVNWEPTPGLPVESLWIGELGPHLLNFERLRYESPCWTTAPHKSPSHPCVQQTNDYPWLKSRFGIIESRILLDLSARLADSSPLNSALGAVCAVQAQRTCTDGLTANPNNLFGRTHLDADTSAMFTVGCRQILARLYGTWREEN